MTQLEPAPQPRPRPSDRARPEAVFQWEPFGELMAECAPLVRRHWQEVSLFDDKLPLDVDWQMALNLAQAGVLHVLTARKNDTLIGYIFNFLLPSLFCSVPWATVHGFWIDPLYREGRTGIDLFKENEKGMHERGARAISLESLTHIAADRGTVGKIFKRLGYTHVGDLWMKPL